MEHMPIDCTLTDDRLAARKNGLLAGLVALSTTQTKLPTGYRLEFPATSDTLIRIAEMIDAERKCCRFLTFALTVAPNLGPIALELSGPEGTREFLESLLELA
jgi:hypothetical protein